MYAVLCGYWRGVCRLLGSVFQTGLPYGQESGGLKTPAIERPSYGRGCISGQFMLGQAMAVFVRFFRITLLSCEVTAQEGSAGHPY